jgi:hypothetical protein
LVQPIFDVLIIDSLNRLYKEDMEYTVIWHELLYLHDSLFKRGSVAEKRRQPNNPLVLII